MCKFIHTPAGISSSWSQCGHEAASSVQRQSTPDQVGPELSLVLVPPGVGPVALHRRLPARRVGTRVLHVPRVQRFTVGHQVVHEASNVTRVSLHSQLAEAGAAHQFGVSIRNESCKRWPVTHQTFFCSSNHWPQGLWQLLQCELQMD